MCRTRAWLFVAVLGCSEDPDVGDGGTSADTGPPPPPAVPLTTEQTIVPITPVDEAAAVDPRDPDALAGLVAQGFGDFVLGAGEPVIAVTATGEPPPPPGPERAVVTRFVHLADAQLADDESPLRVGTLDTPVIAGGFRPGEAHGCRVLNAAVQTVNTVHAHAPLDFLLVGGDNIDSAQANELQWFLGILDGAAAVQCDSGDLDDPVPGEGNDPKDAFAPVGLDVPWLWVSGNHDVLVQGIFAIDGREARAVGSQVPSGGSTRDWSKPGGPLFSGPVVADVGRSLLNVPALLSTVQASGDGHGINGSGTYVWDVPDAPLRLLVVDTAAPTGADTGVVTDALVADVLRPALDQAQADGVGVIVASHHAADTLGDGSGLGGTVQPGALTAEDWRTLLGEYPNVLMHLGAHSHVHRVDWIDAGYWEVVTSALSDWPQQMRVLEVRDEDNGWWTITAIGLDFATEGDLVAAEGRALALTDYTAGWSDTHAGELDDRNVELWIQAP